MPTISLKMPEYLLDKMKAAMAMLGIENRSEFIRRAVEKYCEKVLSGEEPY